MSESSGGRVMRLRGSVPFRVLAWNVGVCSLAD